MLTFSDQLAILNTDSLFNQFEDRNFLSELEMFQENMSTQPDFSMLTEKQGTIATPMTPPREELYTPDPSFQELENYGYSSQPSPTATEMSEQEMDEAYQVVMEDVLSQISPRLGIPSDPTQWSQEHVRAWISILIQEYGPRREVNLANFQIDGYTLCQMSQDELEQRAPENGYLIHSNINCLVKSIQREDVKPIVTSFQQQQYQQSQALAPPMTYDPNMVFHYPMPPMAPSSPPMEEMSPSPVASLSSSDEDESSMSSPAPSPTGPNTSMTPHHTGSIQLWQFLEELLLQPDSYNYCIRFLNRTAGIFKIEDSVEVARLWGMRKNRPAMNYDKLSRSIRQYYKKNIMKKTEISQRLVYQFVKPF